VTIGFAETTEKPGTMSGLFVLMAMIQPSQQQEQRRSCLLAISPGSVS
jgi:hypothetical protein